MLNAKLAGVLGGIAVLAACSSVDVVRLQPDQLLVPKGLEPVAGIQATCLGFYFATLGLPDADLEKAVNELLMKEAKKVGADRVIELRFDGTPSGGIWWLTKLLFFRSASASGIAVRAEPGAEAEGEPTAPLPLPPPPPSGESQPPSAPAPGR